MYSKTKTLNLIKKLRDHGYHDMAKDMEVFHDDYNERMKASGMFDTIVFEKRFSELVDKVSSKLGK